MVIGVAMLLCMVHGLLLHMKLCPLSGLSLLFFRLVGFLLSSFAVGVTFLPGGGYT
jgi:hypothetical protein